MTAAEIKNSVRHEDDYPMSSTYGQARYTFTEVELDSFVTALLIEASTKLEKQTGMRVNFNINL